MNKRPSRFALLAFLALLCTSMVPASLWAAISPQNQCPGDCSPCLGDEDPFCTITVTSSGSGGSSGSFCVLCETGPNNQPGNCRDANVGESGKDDSCTVVTDELRVVSCKTYGNNCTGTVTP
jgi:hypothetical protein